MSPSEYMKVIEPIAFTRNVCKRAYRDGKIKCILQTKIVLIDIPFIKIWQ